MLKRLTVKGRMTIINLSILALFATLVSFSVWNSSGVKAVGIEKAGEVMLADPKSRIQLAVESAALMAEAALDGVAEAAVKPTLRRLVDKIIYEKDRSG
jgi:hypothetical protein